MSQTFQSIPTLGGSLRISRSTLYSTNSGIFFDGSSACLIDPGLLPFEIMSITNFLETQHLKVEYILLTHSHWDHLFGPEYFQGVRVIAHDRFCEELSGEGAERTINRIQNFDRENQIRRPRAFRIPSPDITFERSITIQMGELALNMIHAPGHSSDQCVIYEPGSKILWAADMLSDLEIPYIYYSLKIYQDTLERLAKLEIQQLIPGHGQETQSEIEIRTRFNEDRQYLAELGGLVQTAIRIGKSLEETQEDCKQMHFKNENENMRPHSINVEMVYKELSASK
jgi:glyoxylase-like metal-dependent hydrolase (beta-lactamase superfamily II)